MGRDSTLSITYNVATRSYMLVDDRSFTTGYSDGSTITDPGFFSQFVHADRISNGNYYDTYQLDSDTSTDTLKLFGNVRSRSSTKGAPIKLGYLSFAFWTHTNKQSDETRETYMLFGSPTDADMPKSGSASYKTHVAGSMISVTGANGGPAIRQDIGGSASFDVNFGNGNVATTLSLSTAPDGSFLGDYAGTGTIYAGNQFSGTFTTSDPDFRMGAFLGGFYGPSAVEMGYAFSIYNYDDGLGGASYRPPTNTYFEGVVVGTK